MTNTFRVCEDEIYDYIDHNRIEKDSFRQFCDFTIKKNIEQTLENYKREVERCVRIETDRINNELKRLGDRVNSLQTSFSSMDISNQIKIEIPTIGIKEVLDFTLSVASLAFSGAAIGTFFPIVGNILGAIIGGILGLIIQGIKALFGGESKESKIKRKVSEGLRELKSEVTQKISGVKNKIVSQFEQEIVQPIMNENEQMVIRYKTLQNMFDQNINFLKSQKNNLKNEKYKRAIKESIT